MVNRVCRELGSKRNIVVINDEAHHCYRRKPDGEAETLKGEERTEAEKRNEEARVWISGLEAVRDKIGIRGVYDLSATPFFLRGSGYPEGTLFPWVVSDFSLIDAIESGIVKIPRVPVADDTMHGRAADLPLPLAAHPRGASPQGPARPKRSEASRSSRSSCKGLSIASTATTKPATASGSRARRKGPATRLRPCSSSSATTPTSRSWSSTTSPAGSETLPDGSTVLVPGQLALFSNVEDGRWKARPLTILIDSEQLESGEAMSPEFKQIAALEIEEFKAEYRARFPGRDAESLTDEDLLREVMNTVGKPGKLGEHVRCVVSVSMLTEGWDANTVTHVLGIRAFGTQLLCEQVVGRALRRMSYAANDEANSSPSTPMSTACRSRSCPARARRRRPSPARPRPAFVPLLTGSPARSPGRACSAIATSCRASGSLPGSPSDAKLALTNADLPTKTEVEGIVGEIRVDTLDDLKNRRLNEVAFRLAKLTLEKYFRDDEGHDKPWLFPQLLAITKRWLAECLTCKGGTFPQLLLFIRFAHEAADRIYRSIVASTEGAPTLKPILRPYDTVGTTRYVDFHTIRETYKTRADKCHVSHVAGDSGWELKLAQELEDMPEVIAYVKNQSLGFTIPYTINSVERQYYPDFIVRIDDGHGDGRSRST